MGRETLRIIFAKTGGCCWYCGRLQDPLGNWQVEHQVPRWGGGTDHVDNLVPACRGCNAAKGKRTVEEYRHSLVVKLENLITEAFEMASELDEKVPWVVDPEFPDDVPVPPAWLYRIQHLLSDAAKGAVNSKIIFFGERETVSSADKIVPVQQSETVA